MGKETTCRCCSRPFMPISPVMIGDNADVLYPSYCNGCRWGCLMAGGDQLTQGEDCPKLALVEWRNLVKEASLG